MDKPMGSGLWLNLGCSDEILKEYVNVDIRDFNPEDHAKGTCLVWDLNTHWPWPDATVDYILAKDIIEHLPHKTRTMNEMWRVLKNGGIAHIEVPTTDGKGAFQDPTHVSFWNRNSFFYFEEGNPHRERFGADYNIRARFKILKWKHELWEDQVTKLYITLEAVK